MTERKRKRRSPVGATLATESPALAPARAPTTATGKRRLLVALSVLLGVTLVAPAALRAQVSVEETTLTAKDEEPAPYRGTVINWRNAMSALTLQKDAEPTYNPYYAMQLNTTARWWFDDTFFAGVDFGFEAELTDADYTTRSGELWWNDTYIRFGASRFLRIPVVDIDFSAGIDLIAPTSKVSQARTVYLGVRPSVTISRHFDVLGGIHLAYLFRATKYFNEYTTSKLNGPIVPGCTGGGTDCASLLQTGVRNPSWALTHLFLASFAFTDWVGVTGTVGLVSSYLYPLEGDDSRISTQTVTGTDERHTMVYEFELWTKPMESLGVAVGASTVNPQLAPDSTYQQPFFNRYTTFYVDLRLDVAGLVSQLTPSGDAE